MPPADGRRRRQAGSVPVSGGGVGSQLDGGAVPAGGSEPVGGFLARGGAQAPTDDFYCVGFVPLAVVALNVSGDLSSDAPEITKTFLII